MRLLAGLFGRRGQEDTRPSVRLDDYHWWPFDALEISAVDGKLQIKIDGRHPRDGPGFIPCEGDRSMVEIVSPAEWDRRVGQARVRV